MSDAQTAPDSASLLANRVRASARPAMCRGPPARTAFSTAVVVFTTPSPRSRVPNPPPVALGQAINTHRDSLCSETAYQNNVVNGAGSTSPARRTAMRRRQQRFMFASCYLVDRGRVILILCGFGAYIRSAARSSNLFSRPSGSLPLARLPWRQLPVDACTRRE